MKYYSGYILLHDEGIIAKVQNEPNDSLEEVEMKQRTISDPLYYRSRGLFPKHL